MRTKQKKSLLWILACKIFRVKLCDALMSDAITCHIIKTTRGPLVRSQDRVISTAAQWCLSSCHTPAASVCVCACARVCARVSKTHTQNSARKTLVEHLNVNLTFLQGGEQLRALVGFPPSSLPSSDSNWRSFILWDRVSSSAVSLVNWEQSERRKRMKKQNNTRGWSERYVENEEDWRGYVADLVQRKWRGVSDGCRDLPLNTPSLWATYEL